MRKVEKVLNKEANELKGMEAADKKRDKFVKAGKKAMGKKK